jgi:hypothetical protein
MDIHQRFESVESSLQSLQFCPLSGYRKRTWAWPVRPLGVPDDRPPKGRKSRPLQLLLKESQEKCLGRKPGD